MTVAVADQGTDRAELQDLRDFIEHMAVGVVRFRADGFIDLMNPAASHMLNSLTGKDGADNIFDILRLSCPELRAKVAGATDAAMILDRRRISSLSGRQNITLSLTVTRLRADVHMALLKDVTRLTDMLAFAFASADLLLDVDADGTIGWAGGAFRTLLDMKPQDAVGMPLSHLISPRDRATLAKALMVIGTRGRLPPLLLRLANAGEQRCVLSGLMVEGVGKRILLTIGAPATAHITAEPGVRSRSEFAVDLEGWVRNGHAGILGLLDIEGWQGTAAGLDETQLGCLKHSIGRLAAEAGGQDAVVGQIGDGRIGMLGSTGADLAKLAAALEELVHSFAAGARPRVEHTAINLDAGALSVTQSVQALRLLLARFGAAGTAGAAASGLSGGLAGIIEHAGGQKRALADIIAAGRFTLAYQPIVDLWDRAVHHYEALVRPAPGPTGHAPTPAEFVTLVETVGLSRELDLAVMQRAVALLPHTDAAVGVNISGLSIADPAFTQRLLDQVAGAPPGRLLIEVTETAEIEDLAAAAAQIDRLRAAHVRVCLDDFGAGSASFRYLRELRVDFVKIDGSFVRAAGQSEQGRSFVRAMRELATSSGAATIAEMIETEADATLMRELGVAYGQGWLFGKPAPIAAPVPRVRRWRY
jgi:EAL domain-containing protein (putative c-di-GMP-specific phosphodiesterase class I)/PAS domain-containing protein